jgi:PIN domain nuclease of toxin-antitoxin system
VSQAGLPPTRGHSTFSPYSRRRQFERGQVHFTIPFDQWLEAAAHPRTARLLPITPAVAAELAVLPKTFHRDPADRVIVATCRVVSLPLVSQDDLIIRSRRVKRWAL